MKGGVLLAVILILAGLALLYIGWTGQSSKLVKAVKG
jgi:hypothetical protein